MYICIYMFLFHHRVAHLLFFLLLLTVFLFCFLMKLDEDCRNLEVLVVPLNINYYISLLLLL